MAEQVSVKRTQDDDDYVPPLSEPVVKFRRGINALKGSILDSLATNGNQEAMELNTALNRIRQLGNGLGAILSLTDPEEDGNSMYQMTENMAELMAYFEENGVDFGNLTPEERDMCIKYIKIDIYMHPYDLSLAHINSHPEGRKAHYER